MMKWLAKAQCKYNTFQVVPKGETILKLTQIVMGFEQLALREDSLDYNKQTY